MFKLYNVASFCPNQNTKMSVLTTPYELQIGLQLRDIGWGIMTSGSHKESITEEYLEKGETMLYETIVLPKKISSVHVKT